MSDTAPAAEEDEFDPAVTEKAREAAVSFFESEIRASIDELEVGEGKPLRVAKEGDRFRAFLAADTLNFAFAKSPETALRRLRKKLFDQDQRNLQGDHWRDSLAFRATCWEVAVFLDEFPVKHIDHQLKQLVLVVRRRTFATTARMSSAEPRPVAVTDWRWKTKCANKRRPIFLMTKEVARKFDRQYQE